MLSPVFIINVLSTVLLVGIAWFMQVVQFPLLKFIVPSDKDAFVRTYRDRFTLITFPLMTFEFLTGITILLAFATTPKETAAQQTSYIVFAVSFLLLLINLLITLQVIRPLTNKYLKEPTAVALKKIEQWNWARTISWSVRLVLLITLILGS